jgi:hypothetical protein
MARCKGPDRWTYSLYVSISSKVDEHSETGLSKTCAGTSAMAATAKRHKTTTTNNSETDSSIAMAVCAQARKCLDRAMRQIAVPIYYY